MEQFNSNFSLLGMVIQWMIRISLCTSTDLNLEVELPSGKIGEIGTAFYTDCQTPLEKVLAICSPT